MEKLAQHLQLLHKVLFRFEISFKKLATAQNDLSKFDSDDVMAYRDSCIKRFELSYGLLWKTLEDYLQEAHGIETVSPKTTIHASYKKNFTTQEETDIFLAMIETKNIIMHKYDELMSDDVMAKLARYYSLMKIIADRLTSHTQEKNNDTHFIFYNHSCIHPTIQQCVHGHG